MGYHFHSILGPAFESEVRITKGSDPLDPTMYSSGADLKPFEIQTCRMHIEGLVLSRE